MNLIVSDCYLCIVGQKGKEGRKTASREAACTRENLHSANMQQQDRQHGRTQFLPCAQRQRRIRESFLLFYYINFRLTTFVIFAASKLGIRTEHAK